MSNSFNLDWEELKINEVEIESILQLKPTQKLGLEMALFLDFKQKNNRNNLIIYELVLLFLSLFSITPLGILILSKWLSGLDQLRAFGLVIFIALFLSIVLILVLNLLLWQTAKRMQKTAKNTYKIQRYNLLLEDLKIVTQLGKFSGADIALKTVNISQMKTALALTRESLINGLKLEKLMLANHKFQSQYRDRLMTNIEDELIQFMSIPASTNAEYQNLLTEAIELGLSVHQQMRQDIALSSDLS